MVGTQLGFEALVKSHRELVACFSVVFVGFVFCFVFYVGGTLTCFRLPTSPVPAKKHLATSCLSPEQPGLAQLRSGILWLPGKSYLGHLNPRAVS